MFSSWRCPRNRVESSCTGASSRGEFASVPGADRRGRPWSWRPADLPTTGVDRFKRLGHSVVLLPPHQVRPYVTRNKTDRADAKGILEAYRNADLRPVPVKSIAQQVLGSIHRFRSGWIAARTAHVNTLRGLLREFGFVIPEGIEKVLPQVRMLVADADSEIPDGLRWTLAEACDEIESLGERIRGAEKQLEALAEQTPVVERLRSIPGVGLMTSTALVAFVGDVARFPSGRHFASYLGLTPREYSSGLRQRLGRISKRGDSYLRMLLVHGARSVLCHAKKATSHDRLRTWALALQKRTATTKPRSLWPTSSLASSGRCGTRAASTNPSLPPPRTVCPPWTARGST